MKLFPVPKNAILSSDELKVNQVLYKVFGIWKPIVVSNEYVSVYLGKNENKGWFSSKYLHGTSDLKISNCFESYNIDGINNYNDNYLFKTLADAQIAQAEMFLEYQKNPHLILEEKMRLRKLEEFLDDMYYYQLLMIPYQ